MCLRVCVCVSPDHMSLLILPLTCCVRLRLLCFPISNKWGWIDISKYLDIFFTPCKSHILFFKTLFPPLIHCPNWRKMMTDVVMWSGFLMGSWDWCLLSVLVTTSAAVWISFAVITAAWLSGIMIYQTLTGRSLGFGLQVFRTALRRPTQQMEWSTTSSKDR